MALPGGRERRSHVCRAEVVESSEAFAQLVGVRDPRGTSGLERGQRLDLGRPRLGEHLLRSLDVVGRDQVPGLAGGGVRVLGGPAHGARLVLLEAQGELGRQAVGASTVQPGGVLLAVGPPRRSRRGGTRAGLHPGVVLGQPLHACCCLPQPVHREAGRLLHLGLFGQCGQGIGALGTGALSLLQSGP